jgi:hypothetical protein
LITVLRGKTQSSISQLANNFPSIFEDTGILVTCLDSVVDLSRAVGWFAYLEKCNLHFVRSAVGVYLPDHSATAVIRDGRTFFGFDEIFLVREVPSSDLSPWPEHWTSDRADLSTGVPSSLWDAYSRIGAQAFFADGSGLNYLVTAENKMAQFSNYLSFETSPQSD